MPTSTFTYNLDGAMTAAVGEPFSAIRRHKYTRLPVEITGAGGSGMALRYDSSGRRLHKIGAQAIFYRNGAHHPASDRTKELEKGDEIHHTLVELVDGAEIVYLFTPAGQSVTRREDGYARVARDHLHSVRAEISSAAQITAHYSAFGKSIVTGGELRRAFAGYEPDAETGLYNAHRRLYAPTLRLFVSVDPRLQNESPYPYCNDDPFNNTDPTGGISASTITSIVMALVLVITVVVTIFTGGATGEALAPEIAEETAAEGGSELVDVTASEGFSWGRIAAGIRESMPRTVGGYAKFGAGYGFASSFASNAAGMAQKSANGEHITAWQAVKSMLIEPMIAGAAGAVGGAIAGGELSAGTWILRSLGMSLLGSAAAGAASSIATTAVNGQLATRGGWENIGITMAIAVGEATVMTPFLGRVSLERFAGTSSRIARKPTTLYGRLKELFTRPGSASRRNSLLWRSKSEAAGGEGTTSKSSRRFLRGATENLPEESTDGAPGLATGLDPAQVFGAPPTPYDYGAYA